MKQKVGFVFFGNKFFDYKDLALSMANNWSEAISTIDRDEFLNFFAQNDPYMYGRLLTELRRCKYLDTALSMIIYTLAPSLGVCIKGTFFKTIEDIADCMHQNYPTLLPSIKAFFSDRCVSHVFGPILKRQNRKDASFINEIPFIEQNIGNSLVYKYFLDHFYNDTYDGKISGKMSLDYYFIKALDNDKESLKEVKALSQNPDFLVDLAKKVSFKTIFEYSQSIDYFFELMYLLNGNVTFDLKRLLKKGYHMWMLDNFDHYTFNGPEGNALLSKYKKMNSIKTQIFDKGINSSIESCRNIFTMYQDLLSLYDLKQVVAKSDNYKIQYAYNNTAVCQEYLTEYEIVCPLEIVEQVKSDEEIKHIIKQKRKDAKNEKKQLKKAKRSEKKLEKEAERQNPNIYRGILLQRIIYLLIMALGGIGISVDVSIYIAKKQELINKIFDYSCLISAGLASFISIIFIIKTIFAKRCLDKYYPKSSSLDIDSSPVASTEKEEVINENGIVDLDGPLSAEFGENGSNIIDEITSSKKREELDDKSKAKINRRIFYKFELFSSIVIVLMTFALCCLVYSLLKQNPDLYNKIEFVKKSIDKFNPYFTLIGLPCSIFICIIKRYKALGTYILSVLLSLVVIFAVCAILVVL